MMNRNNVFWTKERISEVQIYLCLLFFGISFALQKSMMNKGMKPITYNAGRYVISTIFLLVAKYVFKLSSVTIEEDENDGDDNQSGDLDDNEKNKEISIPGEAQTNRTKSHERRSRYLQDLWFYGIILGLANFGGSILQQIGLCYVNANKTGFITGMYVVFVPIAEYFIPCFDSSHNSINVRSILSVAISVGGLFLLSGYYADANSQNEDNGHVGEIIVFVSMLFWVVSILAADLASKKVDVISITLVDFFVTTLLTIPLAATIEYDEFSRLFSNFLCEDWLWISAVGFTEAAAFLLSTLGQMYVPPTRAALLFSLEAVVCAICAYLFLGENLNHIELVGAVLMLIAAIISSTNDTGASIDSNTTDLERQPILELKNTTTKPQTYQSV